MSSECDYSSDLASCHFDLFPKTKFQLKSRRFNSIEEIQEKSQGVLNRFTETDFLNMFGYWRKLWDLYTGRLLRRWQQPPIIKFKFRIFIASIHEHWERTSYIQKMYCYFLQFFQTQLIIFNPFNTQNSPNIPASVSVT